MYTSKISPVLEYACAVWHPGLTGYLSDEIERVQVRAFKIMLPAMDYSEALAFYKLSTLKERRINICKSFFSAMEKPSHRLHHLLPPQKINSRSLRQCSKYRALKTKTVVLMVL